jgi:anti-sigma B factor antagonist
MTLAGLAPSTRTVPGLVLSVSSDGGVALLTLRGEADFATEAVLVEALDRVVADHNGDVAVDLSAADFIDSATVRALGRAGQLLTDSSRTLTLRSPSTLALRILTLHGLSHLVEQGGSPH